MPSSTVSYIARIFVGYEHDKNEDINDSIQAVLGYYVPFITINLYQINKKRTRYILLLNIMTKSIAV